MDTICLMVFHQDNAQEIRVLRASIIAAACDHYPIELSPGIGLAVGDRLDSRRSRSANLFTGETETFNGSARRFVAVRS